MIRNRTQYVLQKQQSLNVRLQKEVNEATLEAQKKGLAQQEAQAFVNQKMADYKKIELIRRAVRDVKQRGEELD